jgi:hypothetical protein
MNGVGRPHSHLRVNIPPSAKDYVESLHQNNRATLLYGKNNVVVQPVRATSSAGEVWSRRRLESKPCSPSYSWAIVVKIDAKIVKGTTNGRWSTFVVVLNQHYQVCGHENYG